jgi:hypothetical protein
MYSLEGIRTGLARRRHLVREVNRQYHRRCSSRSHNPTGIDVVTADWDNLVVLDSCRQTCSSESAPPPVS